MWPGATWEQDVVLVIEKADKSMLIVVPGQVGVVGVSDLNGVVTQPRQAVVAPFCVKRRLVKYAGGSAFNE